MSNAVHHFVMNEIVGRNQMQAKSKFIFAVSAALALAACAMPHKRDTPHHKHQGGQVCKKADEAEIAALFERWNDALKTGDAKKVVANYAPQSILLPTVSNKPRLTAAEKEDYFVGWLPNRPSGVVNSRQIQIGCNTAFDAGIYTFTYANGKKIPARYTYTYAWDGQNWLITSHHSSAMPEAVK